jgi:CHAD domain-containing protein
MTAGKSTLRLAGGTPLWQAARHLLVRRGEEYVACCMKTLGTFGLDEIHDFRVSSRRLREALALFAPCYDRVAMRKCSRDVRRVTRRLGALRNLDESFLFLATLTEKLDMSHRLALTPFLMSREAARAPLLAQLERFLGEQRPDRFLKRHRRWLSCPSLVNGPGGIDLFMTLREFAGTAMKEGHEGLLTLVAPARSVEDDAARHRLRIALKHYRYRFELFEPLADNRYGGVYRLMKQYQETLGSLNDLTLFSDMVAGGLVPPPFVQGIRVAIEWQKQSLMKALFRLLDRKPLDTISFPFGE